MGEEELGVATGAASYHLDGACLDPGIKKLTAVCLNEVEVQAGADGRVARGALSEKQHRVLPTNRVGIVYIPKKFLGVRKLRLEARKHVFSNRVAAGANTRTNRGNQILGVRTELNSHAPDAGLDDALHRSTPA